MSSRVLIALCCLSTLALPGGLFAQSKPGTDVLIFVDGEKLIGELKSATNSMVVFKSDIGFEVTVPWAKVQELRSDKKFAAIHKDLTLYNALDSSKVPLGTVEMKEQKLEVTAAPQAPQIIPVKEVANMVSEKSFQRALHRQGILGGWNGNTNFGLSLQDGTISSRTITTSIDLSRADTSENWLPVRNRTTFGFNLYNGLVTQAGLDDTKISIFHSDFVHDWYFKPRWFAFGGATFDHNRSLGLELLQGYGGGIGAVLIKNEHTELDVRAGLGFLRQVYTYAPLTENLIGSRFSENFSHTFRHGITLYEQAGIRPAWNDMKNYFGGGLVSLTVPVYHRLGFNLSGFDSYVNNPPPFRKKNTVQLTIGLNYAFR